MFANVVSLTLTLLLAFGGGLAGLDCVCRADADTNCCANRVDVTPVESCCSTPREPAQTPAPCCETCPHCNGETPQTPIPSESRGERQVAGQAVIAYAVPAIPSLGISRSAISAAGDGGWPLPQLSLHTLFCVWRC